MLSYTLRHLVEMTIRVLKRNQNYTLDTSLTTGSMISIIVRRAVSLFRGYRWRFFLLKCRGAFFVGTGVRIRHVHYLTVGRSVTLDDYVVIDALSREGVNLGDNVSIGAFTIVEATGILSRLGKGFSIGNNSNLGDYCFVGAAGGVEIGDNVIIGQRVSFHSENHVFDRADIPIKLQGTTQHGIVVEDDCWLGSGAVLLDGVTVHRGAVVAAGSVVNNDVPPYSVVGGVPAKVIRMRLADPSIEETR